MSSLSGLRIALLETERQIADIESDAEFAYVNLDYDFVC